MKNVDIIYANLIQKVLTEGELTPNRNGTTYRLMGMKENIRFESTPLVSVRKTAWKNALREMEWFLSGSTWIGDLHPDVKHWWLPWADQDGFIKYNYSKQFRSYADSNAPNHHLDQIDALIKGIKEHPYSRRHVITTWNTAEMLRKDCPLTNCHGTIIQCFVSTSSELHMTMYQRSVDVIVGLPHNWIQYWAFLQWLAYWTLKRIGTFTWIGGDVHIYEEHIELAREIISKAAQCGPTPYLLFAPHLDNPDNDEFKEVNFRLVGEYKPVITTKAKMIV